MVNPDIMLLRACYDVISHGHDSRSALTLLCNFTQTGVQKRCRLQNLGRKLWASKVHAGGKWHGQSSTFQGFFLAYFYLEGAARAL